MTQPAVLEIELKFRLSQSQTVIDKLQAWEIQASGRCRQRDQYFSHPCRDFRETDEALRIRYAEGREILTYKGPKLPGATKSREELEWPFDETIGDGIVAAEGLADEPAATPPIAWLLLRLGFLPVAEVVKERQWFIVRFEGRDLTVSIDSVERLGIFVEVEAVCRHEPRAAVEQSIIALAAALDLGQPVKASYLGMILNSRERDS